MIRWLLIVLLLPLLVFAQPVQTYRISDFSGGMVMDYDMNDLPEKYGSWCYNFNPSRGKLAMRDGYTEWEYDDSTHKVVKLSFYKYTISSPNLNSADADSGLLLLSEGAEITVGYGVHPDSVEQFRMFPTYTANDTAPLGDGAWSNEWSGDFNNPNTSQWRGNSYVEERLSSNGLDCFSAYGGALRMTAGNESALDSIYTYPWWFGYIGRYRFRADSASAVWPDSDVVIDGFYLDYASPISNYSGNNSPLRPDQLFSVSDTSFSNTTYGLLNGVPIDTGMYYCCFVYEYDGYQYAPHTHLYSDKDSLYVYGVHVSTINDNMLKAGIKYHTDDSASFCAFSPRITAVLLFTSDAIVPDDNYYYSPSPDDFINMVPLYFRKRVVVADIDTSNLGYSWKEQGGGGHINWQYTVNVGLGADYWWIYGFIDGDDIKTTNLELWSFLDYASWETVVLPRYSAMVGDQQWAGNVRIDGAISEVKEDYRNMVIISPHGQPDILPINNFLLVGSGAGSYVTGIKEFGGQALIWTNDAFEVWMPGVIPYRLDKFIGSGCTVPRSIQITQSGIFWANHKGIYAYYGTGYPRKISSPVDALFDSLAIATDDYGHGGTSQNTLQYSESVYFPKEKQYALIVDSVYAGKADTSASGSDLWGNLDPPRRYGGNYAIVYNAGDNSWVKWKYDDYLRQFCNGWDGTVYGLRYGGNVYQFEVSPTDCTYDDNMSASWSSGWTDMGVPGREKEIVGIRADYCLNVATAGGAVKPDTLELKVYVDGKDEVYDTYQFYASDSIATGGSNWRRVQWIKSDATGVLITDPARRLPVLYRFDIEMGGDLFYGSSAWGELNALDVDFTVKKQRE